MSRQFLAPGWGRISSASRRQYLIALAGRFSDTGDVNYSAGAGLLSFAGSSAAIAIGQPFAAGVGAVAFAGTLGALITATILAPSPGALTFIGAPGNIISPINLPAGAGSLSFAGSPATLWVNVYATGVGNIGFTGTSSGLNFDIHFPAGPGLLPFSGVQARLVLTGTPFMVSAVRTITVPAFTPTLPQTLLRVQQSWPTRETDEILDYTVDVTAPLIDGGGDLIATVAVSCSPSGDGELTLALLSAGTRTLTFWGYDGVPARNYLVKVLVGTSYGRSLEWIFALPQDSRLASFLQPLPPSDAFSTPIVFQSGIQPAPPSSAYSVIPAINIVTTGSTQDTALPVQSITNEVISAPPVSGLPSGMRLQPGPVYYPVKFYNYDPLNDYLVYPQDGGQIGKPGVTSPGVNMPITVTANGGKLTLVWISQDPITGLDLWDWT